MSEPGPEFAKIDPYLDILGTADIPGTAVILLVLKRPGLRTAYVNVPLDLSVLEEKYWRDHVLREALDRVIELQDRGHDRW